LAVAVVRTSREAHRKWFSDEYIISIYFSTRQNDSDVKVWCLVECEFDMLGTTARRELISRVQSTENLSFFWT